MTRHKEKGRKKERLFLSLFLVEESWCCSGESYACCCCCCFSFLFLSLVIASLNVRHVCLCVSCLDDQNQKSSMCVCVCVCGTIVLTSSLVEYTHFLFIKN